MIQIEMEMADKCSECRFRTDYYYCSAMPKNFCGNTSDEGKPDWCPLKNADGWISVKERLPDIGVKCVIYRDGKMSVARHIANNDWITQAFFTYPTHWMPLPEPPKDC